MQKGADLARIAEVAVDHDAQFMRLALAEADKAAALGEVPIGCVLVGQGGTVLARGHNLRETCSDPTAHAEVVAIRRAAFVRRSWRLDDATLYDTLEPCPMCAGAMVNARLGRLVYGADDRKAGACKTIFSIGDDARLNHRFPITRGVLDRECAQRLSIFFAALRAQLKK
jgi:tRNA(adenine34) deaminase